MNAYTVACTAIYGGYDPLHPHVSDPRINEWICYTDDPELSHPDWTVIVEPPRYPHPRMSAKWRKTHPPIYADRSIWLDGSIQVIDSEFVSMLLDPLEQGADMALFRHPHRNNILDEARYSAHMQKYRGLAMVEQVTKYEQRRNTVDLGLWQSTIFSRMHRPHVLQMGAAWQAHCEMSTYQDQLSLPVLIQDYGIDARAIDADPLKNPWFCWHYAQHASAN